MKPCPSCGGDCGYTKKKGCQYKAGEREWIGLTDEELLEAWHWGGNDPHIEGAHFVTLYKYFETKLKEKNHGNS